MNVFAFVVGAVLFVLAGALTGWAFAWKGNIRIKEENERLNRELHKLTDRDERGRFKGGK